jgi:small subunit ribosomal protein S17
MKIFQGIVLSANNQKTIAVEVTRKWVHPKYKKTVQNRKKYLVHDPDNRAKVGDAVTFKDSRPISKRKRFILVDITSPAKKIKASTQTAKKTEKNK